MFIRQYKFRNIKQHSIIEIQQWKKKLTFATRRLPSGDEKNLGGHSHRSFHPKSLILGPADQISTNYLNNITKTIPKKIKKITISCS